MPSIAVISNPAWQSKSVTPTRSGAIRPIFAYFASDSAGSYDGLERPSTTREGKLLGLPSLVSNDRSDLIGYSVTSVILSVVVME